MPPVTTALIVANVAIYLLQTVQPDIALPFALWPLAASAASGGQVSFQYRLDPGTQHQVGRAHDAGEQSCGTFTRVDGIQRGVGSALFAATRDHARSLGMEAVNAEIRADNKGGLTFYGKQGFKDYRVEPARPLRDGTPMDRMFKRYMLGVEQQLLMTIEGISG